MDPHPKVYKAFILDHTIISVPDFTEVRCVLLVACGMDPPPPPVLSSGGNLGNSTFACTLQWCMQICHKPFAHQLIAIWKCSFTIFFLLKMQIWNGCNVFNIAGNPIKDINAKLSFQSLASNVMEWIPPVLTSGGNLGNSTFACTLQWCMQICHKPFAHQLRAIWKC